MHFQRKKKRFRAKLLLSFQDIGFPKDAFSTKMKEKKEREEDRPMRLLEELTSPGVFDLTHSSTKSFHFLPGKRTHRFHMSNFMTISSLST